MELEFQYTWFKGEYLDYIKEEGVCDERPLLLYNSIFRFMDGTSIITQLFQMGEVPFPTLKYIDNSGRKLYRAGYNSGSSWCWLLKFSFSIPNPSSGFHMSYILSL